MISAFLLYSGKFSKAKDALEFYAKARTYDGKGVTIPSQIRYIQYFEKSLSQGWNESKVVLKLNKIRMLTIPKVSSGGCKPLFIIKNDHKDKKAKYFNSGDEMDTNFIIGKNFYDFNIKSDLYLIDDVKIEFYDKGLKKK